jgi:hypothetical protein
VSLLEEACVQTKNGLDAQGLERIQSQRTVKE